MGNRANIGFKQGESTIFLYQHWAPEHLFKQYAQALEAAKPRWDDSSYATRIMISQIIGEDWANETGYGISMSVLDNEHKVVVVDLDEKRVRLYDDADMTFKDGQSTLGTELFSLSFLRFVEKYA
jgi:hypothetical protein